MMAEYVLRTRDTAAGTASTLVVGSPVGAIALEANEEGLTRVGTRLAPRPRNTPSTPDALLIGAEHHLRAAEAALQLYFEGAPCAFDDLFLRPSGTPFQRRVWRELLKVRFGETISYGNLATRIGRPGAARAVGQANARNPIGIIQPCHRVVGASGALTGFGGGLEMKAWLLSHEGSIPRFIAAV